MTNALLIEQNKIIDEIKDWPIIKELMEDENVICMYLGGSFNMELVDQYSDVDICVLVNDSFECSAELNKIRNFTRLFVGNRHAHIVLNNVSACVSHNVWILPEMKVNSTVFYDNPKYNSVSVLTKYSEGDILKSCRLFFEYDSAIKQSNHVWQINMASSPGRFTKSYSRFVYAYNIITNNLDVNDIMLLKRFWHHREEFTSDEIEHLENMLVSIDEYTQLRYTPTYKQTLSLIVDEILEVKQ